MHAVSDTSPDTPNVSPNWLANYRGNIRRILESHKFESIDFLPEPFAAFQYYRYGLRHPLVMQQRQFHALVIDFGGGTCDSCIIETTKSGDIKEGGRNSRPKAANSTPIGGFLLNRVIVEELLLKQLPARKADLKKGFELYKKWRSGLEVSAYADKYLNFLGNFDAAVRRAERPKIALCRSIASWRLGVPLEARVSIDLPQDPFSANSELMTTTLTVAILRGVFEGRIWQPHLRPLIQKTIERGREELSGAPISVVLLSGGSANIGWLAELTRRDLGEHLEEAPILSLPDFQEVVSKGLALECARRFYNDKQGDFACVTYNRLNLVLTPDRHGQELPDYVPQTEELPRAGVPAALLPSASVLHDFIGKKMRWKAKLSHPPRRQLQYFFLRSSIDTNDIENLQNIEQKTLVTPPDTSFGASIQIELTVRSDGTAEPRFIYRVGPSESETTGVIGRKCFLDMTACEPLKDTEAYVGIDFGTSNSSLSFVDQQAIEVFEQRAGQQVWRDLGELADLLPYPLSAPLARYISEADPSRLVDAAFQFTEAALSMAVFVSYVDFCLGDIASESRHFSRFTRCSAGTLMRALKTLYDAWPEREGVSRSYRDLVKPSKLAVLDPIIEAWADIKHWKTKHTAGDVLRPVQVLANVSQRVFATWQFGFFEHVEKESFGCDYVGRFRIAHGEPTFKETLSYRGPVSFSHDQAMLVQSSSGTAVGLQPVIFWYSCEKHPDADYGHCFMFDSYQNGIFSYKSVGYRCSCNFTVDDRRFGRLAEVLTEFRKADKPMVIFKELKLSQAGGEGA
jgi:hypothetical protein